MDKIFGWSHNLPNGTSCYLLLLKGITGAFYEINSELNITKIADVMPEHGHRHNMPYALADPTFDKGTAEFSRLSDTGKLMALASFSKRNQPTSQEEAIMSFLLQDCEHLRPRDSTTYSWATALSLVSLLLTTGAMAAPVANLKIDGKVTPPTCTINGAACAPFFIIDESSSYSSRYPHFH